jgi:putative ABC transport system ATP-binding protein
MFGKCIKLEVLNTLHYAVLTCQLLVAPLSLLWVPAAPERQHCSTYLDYSISRLAYENIELPLLPRGLQPKYRRELVEKALLAVGGDLSWLSKKPSQLSGGQQQRVAIARAIVGNPEILLADEPTGNLDRASAKTVVETFAKLNVERGLTIVVVTHDPEIAHCTEKIYVLRDGSIVDRREPFKTECILSKL